MKREILRSYFEKTCSESEAAEVEQWLLDPAHQQAFEHFLETYWQEHVDAREDADQPVSKNRRVVRLLPWAAVAAATFFAIIMSARYFTRHEPASESPAVAWLDQPKDQAYIMPDTLLVADGKKVKPGKSKPVKRAATNSQPMIALADRPDSGSVATSVPKSVKVTTMNKVALNEGALNKLSESERMVVLNKMALNVNFNHASFNDIAAEFRDKYGIVLELCDSSKTGGTAMTAAYTARLSNVTFPHLIDDMSKQMMFSYTMSDNVVKVCFN